MRTFSQFACFDWSGQAVARPKGIALAIARAGAQAPALVASGAHASGYWSREAVLDWLIERADEQANMIIGFDFSFALPFQDRSAYFPEWENSPSDARSLWALVDELTDSERHLSASTLPLHPDLARHFRTQSKGAIQTGDLFEPGLGRLRQTERLCRDNKQGSAVSCFNLIGAAQVGKSSLTGMRTLNRLEGRIPIWPFDDIPDSGPVIVEIYTAIAARAAGLNNATKMRTAAALEMALSALGSNPSPKLTSYDDHSTDAVLTAAWLRHTAGKAPLWQPSTLTGAIAQKEGWTFGVE